MSNVWNTDRMRHELMIVWKSPSCFSSLNSCCPCLLTSCTSLDVINSWSSHVAVSVSCTAWQRSPEWAIPQWLCWRGAPINQLCAEHTKWFLWCTVCPAGETAHMKYCGVTQKYCCMSECGSSTCVCLCVSLSAVLNGGRSDVVWSDARPARVCYMFVIIHCHDNININITLVSQCNIFTSVRFTFWCWYTAHVQKSQRP